MQRVSIARALVNDPEIILADEPTGALDSNTSVQIMDLLAEIAKTRLVIMVTHNGELAQQYSTRIVSSSRRRKGRGHQPLRRRPRSRSCVRGSRPEAAARAAVVAARQEKLFADIKEFFHNLRMRKHLKRDRSAMSYTTAINLRLSTCAPKEGAHHYHNDSQQHRHNRRRPCACHKQRLLGVHRRSREVHPLMPSPIMINETTYDQKAVMQLTNFVKVAQESSLEAYPRTAR